MAKKRPTPKKKTSQRSTRKTAGKSSRKPTPGVGVQRLNKVLASAGLGSRREVEELIVQGRVEVDREVVTDLACKVDPQTVTLKVDGQVLKKFRPVYFALNKPKGVLSTNKDPSGRMRVVDLVPDRDRVFSVGRLDRSSEGLMLLTNDGELAQRLAHPRYRVQKTYFVVVSGVMTREELDKLRKGVHLAEGFARIDGATIRRHRKGCTEVEIALSEGKNREIRRILARAGHKVVVLRRIAIGSLRLGLLPVGASRKLTAAEVRDLYALTESTSRPKRSAKKNTSATNKRSGSRTEPDKVPPQLDDEEVSLWADDQGMGDEALGPMDDDFIGGFDGLGSTGSVLSYEEEEPVVSEGADSACRTSSSRNRSSKSNPKGRRGGRTQRATSPKGKVASKKAAAKRKTVKRSTPTASKRTTSKAGGRRPASTRSKSGRSGGRK